jgi:hypothetical protein
MRWLILTAASVFHIEEPVGSYDCFGHFILLSGRGKDVLRLAGLPQYHLADIALKPQIRERVTVELLHPCESDLL